MATGRPKVLCVFQKSPVPDITGHRRRLLRLMNAAQGRFDVHLLVVTGSLTPVDRDALSASAVPADVVELTPAAASARRLVRWLFGLEPPLAWLRRDVVRAKEAVEGVISAVAPDLIWASSPFVVDAVLGGASLPIAVDVSHVERAAIDSQLRSGLRWRTMSGLRPALVLALDRRARLRAEVRGMNAASMLLPCSSIESDATARLCPTPSVEVLNGVDLPPAIAWSPGSRRLLFVANYGYAPNDEAMRLLVDRVLPERISYDPAVTLRLVGPGIAANDRVRSAAGVVVEGFVDDLAEVYASSELMVAPLMAGSGTKLKVLEAFGYGLPVVTTPKGAEGLPFTEREAAVGSTIDELVAKSIQLLADHERGDAQRRAARRWAENGYSWDAIGEQFCDALEALLAR